jgi:hypothetical protein
MLRSTLPKTMAKTKKPFGFCPISCGAIARKIPNVVFSRETLHLGMGLVKAFPRFF